MNIAVILAGGMGIRMNQGGTPKQFLEAEEKPILIHTIEKFEKNKNIGSIVVVCVAEWLEYCQDLIRKAGTTKVKVVVKGGVNRQESEYNGLKAALEISINDEDIVLIHDGVRPLINNELIDNNIASVKEFGSAITCVECKETIAIIEDNKIIGTTVRDNSRIARSPQSFYLRHVLDMHEQARKDASLENNDTCTLMRKYNQELAIVMGLSENIKITTPDDYYVFKALLESKKTSEILGL